MNPVLEHIRAGRFDAIDRWLTDRHHASCDANAFLLDAILSLLGDREDIILEKLHASFPDEGAFRYLTLYGLASKTALMGDLENTVRHLREAARFAYLSTGVFFEDPAFCHTGFKIQQQAAYIDCRLPGNAPDENLAKIDWRGCSEGNVNLVLLAAANGVYMEHFAETFLRSLDAVDWPEGTVVHLHVSNPPDDRKNLFSGLSNVSPIALCISTDSIGDVPAVVFACRRFIIAAAVMERYRADIITLDIDSIAQEPLGRVPGAMEGADIGLFEGMLGVEPQLICSCAMVFFRNTPAAHCFLETLSAYIRERLLEVDAFWTLDQCAFFALTRHLASHPDDPAWAGGRKPVYRDLSPVLGGRLENYLESQEREGLNKDDLRRDTTPRYLDITSMNVDFADDGRLLFKRKTPG